jgi:hypothetical protein
VSEVLKDSRTRSNPIWDAHFLEHIVSEHSHGRKNYVLEIDAVLTLEAVERLLFRDLPRGSGSLKDAHHVADITREAAQAI